VWLFGIVRVAMISLSGRYLSLINSLQVDVDMRVKEDSINFRCPSRMGLERLAGLLYFILCIYSPVFEGRLKA